jgi:polar amino acid transport system substrate-binding protein
MWQIAFDRSTRALCTVAAFVLVAGPAFAQQAKSPGAGFADPDGAARQAMPRDVDAVYRRPSIDTLATVRKRGTLRVGIAANDPAVMHDANDRPIGLSIDIARRLAEDMGVEVEFVETSWSHIVPDLLNLQFDLIISGMWVTPARALVMNFTHPTASEGVYLFANKKLADGMKTAADFNRPEVKLVVYGGTMQELLAKRDFPNATLVVVTGDANHLTPVIDGSAHAALIPTFAPSAVLSAAPDSLFLPFGEKPVASTSSAIAMRKGDADMLNYLNTVLEFHRGSGWLGERARYWSDELTKAR